MLRQSRFSPRLAYAGQLLALTIVYVLLGRLGLTIAPVSVFATVVWPPTGLSLAALAIGGYRFWPAIAIGALITNLAVGAPPLVACAIAAGNTLEALIATFALRRIPGFQGSLERFAEVVGLFLVATLSSIAATAGVASLALHGLVSQPDVARTWVAWWTGDFMSDILLAPVILTWVLGPRVRLRAGALLQAGGLGTLLVALAWLIFFTQGSETQAQPPLLRTYLLFIPLTWAAFSFGARGAATSTFLLGVVAIWGTYTGHGPFADPYLARRLVALHVFLASASLASLALGSVVSERKRSQEELSERESALRGVIDGATDAIYVKDWAGRYLILNAASARLLGLPPEAIGKDDAALLPKAADAIRDMDQEVMRTGQPKTVEESFTIGGRSRVFHSTRAPYLDRAGRVLGVIGISRDITELRAYELARARLAAIVDSSTDPIIGSTLDGTITSWNAAAERLYGYSPEEAIGGPISMIIPPERWDERAEFRDKILRGDRIENREIVHLRKDGTRVEVALTLSPIRDSRGAVIGLSAIGRDITKRRRVEQQLRDNEERQRLAVEAAHLGVWWWDLKRDRLVWTPECRTMHGVGPGEEVSRARFFAALDGDDRESVEREVARSLGEHADYRVEYRAVWPDGSAHWISVLGRAFYDKAGAPDRMLGVALDVTAEKRAARELAELLEREQAARAEAQASTRAKDEFLAVLSHELRTPLQSMLGWTQILKKQLRDPTMQKGFETIERNVRIQAQLIEDLLDVSRIAAGKLRLERTRVDLARVVYGAIDAGKTAAEAKSVELETTLEPVGGEVLGDPDRLRQVVSNLISNAVKFTPKGGRIGVRLTRDGDTARLVVEDNGCGIAPAFLSHVFDRFRQAESTTMRSHGGLGLGLAIVRHLVDLHGGTVTAESLGEGQGARFTVTLPLVRVAPRAVAAKRAPQDRAATPVALDGVRVLVVDDDADACELLEMALREEGAEVRAVQSARAALEVLASFRPQLLISDIAMPEEDGYALVRQVRERESIGGGHVPAVALTAFASRADREQALASGFDGYLAKPASPDEIARMTARLVKQERDPERERGTLPG